MSRAERIRRRKLAKRLQFLMTALLVVALCALAWMIVLIVGRGQDRTRTNAAQAPAVQTPAAEPSEEAAVLPTELEPTPTLSPTPTPEPTPEPEPTPTPDDGKHPNVIGLYIRTGKTEERGRLTSFTGKWKKGKDIDCFGIIASDKERLDGSDFRDIFGTAWYAFEDADSRKIGVQLRYTLDDGQEICLTIRSPKDIEHTEYVECWLYDDLNQKKGVRYSHLKESKMKEETLITSIKLTCGDKISHVQEMYLAPFIYASDADFGPNGRYAGSIICEIPIYRKT